MVYMGLVAFKQKLYGAPKCRLGATVYGAYNKLCDAQVRGTAGSWSNTGTAQLCFASNKRIRATSTSLRSQA